MSGYQSVNTTEPVYPETPGDPQIPVPLDPNPPSYHAALYNAVVAIPVAAEGPEESIERPAILSVAGFLMCYNVFVLFFSWIASFMTIVGLGSSGATVYTGAGVKPFNIMFTGGFLAFSMLFFNILAVLCEIHLQVLVSRVPLVTNHLFKGCFFLYFTFINMGFAGDFGIATATFILLAAILNTLFWVIRTCKNKRRNAEAGAV